MVDDNPDIITSLKVSLEDVTQGYRILGAENGQKCLEMLKDNIIPDVIILDIMMPQMSGWEVFDQIKKNPSWNTIPVIFLTARTDRVAKNAGGFLGDDFIEKPFEIVDLKKRIEIVFQNKASRKTQIVSDGFIIKP